MDEDINLNNYIIKRRKESQKQPEIFKIDMLNKLMMEKNLKKESWKKLSSLYLLDLLEKEVLELREALLLDFNEENIISECADVANFAMMIADRERLNWEVNHIAESVESRLKDL